MKIFRNVACLLLAALMLGMVTSHDAAAEEKRDIAYSYAEKREEDYRIQAALIVAAPLDDYLYVSARVSYCNPVNYAISHFHLYINHRPAEKLPFIDQPLAEAGGCLSYAGVFQLPEGTIDSLELVPVIETANAAGTETEEMTSSALYWADFKQKE